MLQKHSTYLLVSFLVIALLFQGCSPKYIYPEKILERGFETYDTSIYPLQNDTVFFTKKNRVEINLIDDGYLELTQPNSSYYVLYKYFYANGNIEIKAIMFGDYPIAEAIGLAEIYNEEGELIETINEDERFGDKFNYNDILDYLHKRRVINKYRKKPNLTINANFYEDAKEWEIRVYETDFIKSCKCNKQTVSIYRFNTQGKVLIQEENIKVINIR